MIDTLNKRNEPAPKKIVVYTNGMFYLPSEVERALKREYSNYQKDDTSALVIKAETIK